MNHVLYYGLVSVIKSSCGNDTSVYVAAAATYISLSLYTDAHTYIYIYAPWLMCHENV